MNAFSKGLAAGFGATAAIVVGMALAQGVEAARDDARACRIASEATIGILARMARPGS